MRKIINLVKKINKNQLLNLLFFLLLLVLSFSLHSFIQNNSDEGIITAGAWSLFNGKELYVDFFEFIPPGSFYLLLFVWKIFGASFFSAKIFSIFILSLSAYGIFKCSKLIESNRYFSYLFPIIFVYSSNYWPIINHNFYCAFFSIWAIFFLLKSTTANTKINLVISGLLASFSILILQHKGSILLLSIFLFLTYSLFTKKNKITLKLFTYFSIASLSPLLILLKWPISSIYKSLIYTPLFKYTDINKMTPILFYTYLFFFTYYLFTILKYKYKHKNLSSYIFLFLLQFLLLLSTLQRPDFYHVNISIFVLLMLSPLLVKIINDYKKIYLICINYFILFTFFMLVIAPSTIHLATIPRVTKQNYKQFISVVRENCHSAHIYAGPFIPQFYLMTHKKNPTQLDVILTNHTTEKQLITAKESIAKENPDCLILNYQYVEKFKYNKKNPLDTYLKENYREIASMENSETSLYKIKTQ